MSKMVGAVAEVHGNAVRFLHNGDPGLKGAGTVTHARARQLARH